MCVVYTSSENPKGVKKTNKPVSPLGYFRRQGGHQPPVSSQSSWKISTCKSRLPIPTIVRQHMFSRHKLIWIYIKA